MRLFYSMLFCLFSVFCHAQKLGPYTISTTGTNFETESISLYVSIGEPLNTMLSDGEITVSQGILQIMLDAEKVTSEPCANNTSGTLFFENCDDGTLFFFVKTDDGKIYDPYYAEGLSFEHTEGELKVNFGFADANFNTPCSLAEKAIIIHCIEEAIVSSTNEELSSKMAFSLFPNPTKNTLKLQLDHPNNTTFDLQIFDLQGKELFSQSNVNHKDLVDISNLPDGLYHLSIVNELQQRQTIKLVKN